MKTAGRAEITYAEIPDESPDEFQQMPNELDGYWWETQGLVCIPVVIARQPGYFWPWLETLEAKGKTVFFPTVVNAKLGAKLRLRGYTDAFTEDRTFGIVTGLALFQETAGRAETSTGPLPATPRRGRRPRSYTMTKPNTHSRNGLDEREIRKAVGRIKAVGHAADNEGWDIAYWIADHGLEAIDELLRLLDNARDQAVLNETHGRDLKSQLGAMALELAQTKRQLPGP